jgi:hypothetical protein
MGKWTRHLQYSTELGILTIPHCCSTSVSLAVFDPDGHISVGVATGIPPIYSSHLPGITDLYHHTRFFDEVVVLLIFCPGWPKTTILPIFPILLVAGIMGVSHCDWPGHSEYHLLLQKYHWTSKWALHGFFLWGVISRTNEWNYWFAERISFLSVNIRNHQC